MFFYSTILHNLNIAFGLHENISSLTLWILFLPTNIFTFSHTLRIYKCKTDNTSQACFSSSFSIRVKNGHGKNLSRFCLLDGFGALHPFVFNFLKVSVVHSALHFSHKTHKSKQLLTGLYRWPNVRAAVSALGEILSEKWPSYICAFKLYFIFSMCQFHFL